MAWVKMRLASYLYRILSWGIVALGTLHMLTTAALRGGTPAGRVWFFGAGIAMVLSGSLNLLNSAYGAGARGVRWGVHRQQLAHDMLCGRGRGFHGCTPGAVRHCARSCRRCDSAVVVAGPLKPGTIKPTAGSES
jgi:hypothetical protein